MELSEAIRRRRMVRTYDPHRPVPQSVVTLLLEHAVRAPSAGFSQGWDFLVLRAAADRELFWAVTAGLGAPGDWLDGMRAAPLLVVCWSDAGAYLDRYAEPDKGWADRDRARWPVPYWDVDTGMAALLMLLTAVDAGLGGCFFGVPPGRHGALREAFGVPVGRTPVGFVSVGYPAPGERTVRHRRRRRPLPEVAHEGRFGEPFTG